MFRICPVLALLFACQLQSRGDSRRADRGASAARRQQDSETRSGGALDSQVANYDPSGTQAQPDWDARAELLGVVMEARMPQSLPATNRVACQEMLDAAEQLYATIESDESQKQKRMAELRSTRAEDQSLCEQETSLKAAVCVRLRLEDKDAEFAWLLDQCSRAFPKRVPGVAKEDELKTSYLPSP